MHKKILGQIIREFWFPILAAIIWTIADLYSDTQPTTFVRLIKTFGPAFFFISWLLAQYWRIQKQMKVESSFSTVESKIIKLTENLEIKTNNLVNHLTGGDSFPYLDLKKASGTQDDERFYFTLENSFEFPIFKIIVQIFDYNKLISFAYSKNNEGGQFMKMADYIKARDYLVELDELPANSSRNSEDLLTPKEVSYFVKINTRNQIVFQKIVMIQKGAHFWGGFSVVDISGTTLKEEIWGEAPAEIQNEIKAKFKEIKWVEYKYA